MPRNAAPLASLTHPSAGVSTASFVVLLSFEGTYRGLAGPFPTAAAADAWAGGLLTDRTDWSWNVEPVVSPQELPTTAPGPAATRPHLVVMR